MPGCNYVCIKLANKRVRKEQLSLIGFMGNYESVIDTIIIIGLRFSFEGIYSCKQSIAYIHTYNIILYT